MIKEINSSSENYPEYMDSAGENNYSWYNDTIMYEFNNTTENTTSDQEQEPSVESVMLIISAVVALIIAGLGIIGNLLTIIALLTSQKLRSGSTLFIVNLALTEFLFCVIILPIFAAQYIHLYIHSSPLLSDESCVFVTAVKFSITQAEIQTIMGIALTRAIVMRNPQLYYDLNRQSFNVAYFSFIWLYSFIIHLPQALGSAIENRLGSYNFNPATRECDIAEDAKITRLIAQIIECLIPILIIFICYTIIYVTVKQSSKMVTKASRKDKDIVHRKQSQYDVIGQTAARDLRVARSIFIIFIILLVCSIPIAALHTKKFAKAFPKLFLGMHFLYWFQYCINPVVYLIMNPSYRKAFKDLFSRCIHCWSNTEAMDSSYSNRTSSRRISESSYKGRKISMPSTSRNETR